MKWLILAAGLLAFPLAGEAWAQSVQINASQPCFLPEGWGPDRGPVTQLNISGVWTNCGLLPPDYFDQRAETGDWLAAIILPWEWITGGYLSSIIVAMIIFLVWIIYRNVLYPITAGTLFLPFSYFLFPEHFLVQAIIFTGVWIAAVIWYAMFRQTKDYP